MQIPSIPKGTRDFTPAEMVKRNYIFDSIKDIFRLFGYAPIETPAMENLSTLLGKYGDEGDKLLFRILNSGDFLRDTSPDDFTNPEPGALSAKLCEKGLRYDLTVPFARFVVQHQHEISFPFKRFQVQPVWRADRPQKGRYREFYQCDVDVVGSNSLLNEVELIQIIDKVFDKLGISVTIKLNNRKILAGIAEYINAPHLMTDITIAIDKLDKIGLEKVNEELAGKGLSSSAIEKLQPVMALGGSNHEKLSALKKVLANSETGLMGIAETETVFSLLELSPVTTKIELDLTLARGLNYYTGAIFEVKANDVPIGSICGGGRYDDLTGIFGMKNVSGVGISFGADRIYDVMTQLDVFPKGVSSTTKVLLTYFGEKEQLYSLSLVKKFRDNEISCELYPDVAKLKKSMNYANGKNIPFVIIIGEEEMQSGLLTLKNMETGNQQKLSVAQAISEIIK
ncbi:MAG: histidine--tRNA ligase [Bacteroidales bacterium]|nr:histidine--tRNA ligase [Bacteroidales bacterium]